MNRRDFLKTGALAGTGLALAGPSLVSAGFFQAPSTEWLRMARVFRIDGYSYPLSERIDYDAEQAAEAFVEMRMNIVRMATMGKYSYIQGIRFTNHPDLGSRDLLAETIAACKPRGIRVIPYISNGNRLAVTLLTRDYPEYAQAATPGGGPRVMDVPGEDRANTCWNSAYRQAYLDYVRHVAEDYDVDALYFDAWMNAWYHYERPHTCYCQGCRDGFLKHAGLEIPYHASLGEYTPEERATVRHYLEWKHSVMLEVFDEVHRIAQRKNLPLITNANNPTRLALTDPHMAKAFQAYLYEGLSDYVARAEANSAGTSTGVALWPSASRDPGQIERLIVLNSAFGAGQIVTNQGLLRADADRTEVAGANRFLAENEDIFRGFSNQPHAGVLFQDETRLLYATISGAFHSDGTVHTYSDHTLRSSTRGAYSALLNGPVQVSSLLPQVLEDEELLSRYAVLFLPEVPYLTPQQVDNIRQFVRRGGGLVASFETSRFFENASRRESPELQDLFGFEFDGPAPAKAPTSTLWLRAPRLLEGEVGRRGFNLDESLFEPIRPTAQSEVLAEFAFEDGQSRPAILLSRYGAGKVAYVAFPLGNAWEKALEVEISTHHREAVPLSLAWGRARDLPLGRIAVELAHRTASRPAPYEVSAGVPLIVNLTGNADRRVLHLLRPGESAGESDETGELSVLLRNVSRAPELRPAVPHRSERSGSDVTLKLARVPPHLSILYRTAG